MQGNKVLWIGGVIVVIFVVWVAISKSGPGAFDAFAQCLTEKGATYYGAFWCPNCAKQNEIFGKSKKFVNYIECSTPDSRSQKQVCRDAGITNYPTWEFAGGTSTRLIGVQQLEKLGELTGCELPQET